MSVFFTSDLHLGHEKVSTIRGFETTLDHDAAISDAWASVVRPDDDVWVLGDLAASSPWHALSVLGELPGRKHLIYGNHDRAHPMSRDAHKWQPAYGTVFASQAQSARRRIEGVEVLLSHFPYERDRHEIRHAQWRLRDEGLPLLHGHTHGPERLTVTSRVEITNPGSVEEDWTGDYFLFGREFTAAPQRVEIHVGVDAWDLKPVPLETISELLAEARA